MSDSPPVVELRRSVALLATEWWVFVGIVGGYVLFGAWVGATGIAFMNAVPRVATEPVTSVGTVPITGRDIFALVAWLLAPAVAAAWLLGHRLSNNYGNIDSQYRLDNPGALPAPSGALMVVATLAALVAGPRWPVVGVLAVASVHLFVRTIVYGRRVYSVSWLPLFWVMTTVSGVCLAAAWLVQAVALPEPVGGWLALAVVSAVAESGLAVAGTTPATAAGALVTVPALLAGGYLAVQATVARSVRAKAPLAAPDKRAEQRFPIMPPVSQGARSDGDATDTDRLTPIQSPTAAETTTPRPTETVDGGTDTGDDNSQTQVFTADESIPEGEEAVTAVAEAEAEDDDEWIDDTSIFSLDGGPDGDDCGVCGDPLPEDTSVTFCPNCGQQIRD